MNFELTIADDSPSLSSPECAEAEVQSAGQANFPSEGPVSPLRWKVFGLFCFLTRRTGKYGCWRGKTTRTIFQQTETESGWTYPPQPSCPLERQARGVPSGFSVCPQTAEPKLHAATAHAATRFFFFAFLSSLFLFPTSLVWVSPKGLSLGQNPNQAM